MKSLIRWLIFILIGAPFQLVVYIVYPLAYIYWRLFIFKDYGDTEKVIVNHLWVTDHSIGNERREPGDLYLNTIDDHNAFAMIGNIDEMGMGFLLDKQGHPVRRVNEDWSLNQWQTSGDCVINWLFAYVHPSLKNKPAHLSVKFAYAYLKALGTKAYDTVNKGDVSSRCNNFGINYCPDSGAKGIGQPMTGPQFYTNSCLFAVASQTSFFFKIVFWVHWILFGGWYWAFMPVIWPANRPLHYVRDMTMRALYIHKVVFGNKWWIRIPMEFICYRTTPYRNDFWYAMMGYDPLLPIPDSLDCFFPQKADAKSVLSDRMNGKFGPAILEIAKQARSIK